MSFKVASKFIAAANIANSVPKENFSLFLEEVFKRLKDESATELFTDKQMDKMSSVFDLDSTSLQTLIGGVCYAFEQAAFTATSPEDLFNLLVEQASFDEPHAKVMGRFWAREEKAFKERLKKKTLGAREMVGLNYHLNLTMADSQIKRILEPTAIFEFTLNRGDESLSTGAAPRGCAGCAAVTGLGANPQMEPHSVATAADKQRPSVADTGTSSNTNSKFAVELTHDELYDWFQQLEQVQHALDAMAPK